MGDSVLFEWDFQEFESLVDACKRDDGVQLALKYLTKDKTCLEAGCGTGRVVKYLTDLGYPIEGIELNSAVVREVNSKHPDLKISVGDILKIPSQNSHYSGILSFGVIEHFPRGLEEPLEEMYRVLAPGGRAIITVPSFNYLRRIKHFFERFFNPKTKNFIRKVFGKKVITRNKEGFHFHVYPQFGEFFEYRLRPIEFEREIQRAGFTILASLPIAHIDGIYSEFGPSLCHFENWKFSPTLVGRVLNHCFKKVPFFHNHMHACVVTKA